MLKATVMMKKMTRGHGEDGDEDAPMLTVNVQVVYY